MKIEKLYQSYLKKVNLSEKTMHPIQSVETKRAFFGAAGMLILFFRDEIGDMEENEAIEAMEAMKNEVANFWNEQNNLTN